MEVTKTQLTSPIDSFCLVSHNVWPELCVGARAEVSTQCHYSTARQTLALFNLTSRLLYRNMHCSASQCV